MAKGYEQHRARVIALQGMGKDLARRAKSKCEITGASGQPLFPYEVPPIPEQPDIDRVILVCGKCRDALENPNLLAGREWNCLTLAVWSELPAIQVVAWRMLSHMAQHEHWAREALEHVFLEPEIKEWAESEKL